MKYLIIICLFISCSHKTKSNKHLDEKLTIAALTQVRPFLKSDEFRFMGCELIKTVIDPKHYKNQEDLWKIFGTLELRKMALKEGANMMSLHEKEIDQIKHFTADLYSCEKINQIKKVSHIGMCSPTEEKVFTFKFERDKNREIGKVYVEEMVKYYGIKNYFKSYSVNSIKYSYTNEIYSANASFFNCF